MIEIFEPRYRDKSVLIARYKIPAGQDITIKILKGAYAGEYRISNEAICASPIEKMKTKRGDLLTMRAVPLDKLERINRKAF